MVELITDYKTVLPKEGNNPKIDIIGDDPRGYVIRLIDLDKREIVSQGVCYGGQTVMGHRQWYTNWIIEIYDADGNKLKTSEFQPQFKKIFIKIDSYALGDNIAWMPYIEEFRKKHNCDVICSTFCNEFFVKAYPEILFVKPNTNIDNVYAQYYIGASDEPNIKYSPVLSSEVPLQSVAASILGLEYTEIRPNITFMRRPKNIDGKYVCISEWASSEDKKWKQENGWQDIVDYFNSVGYKVVVISKEPTQLTGVIDRTGDIPLNERMNDIYYSEMFLGVSSGLSWLAWALNKQVVMISDVNPDWHEFKSKNLRFCKNILSKVDYTQRMATSSKEVLDGIRILVES